MSATPTHGGHELVLIAERGKEAFKRWRVQPMKANKGVGLANRSVPVENCFKIGNRVMSMQDFIERFLSTRRHSGKSDSAKGEKVFSSQCCDKVGHFEF